MDMPEYVLDMIEYISGHSAKYADMRSGLNDEAQISLAALEVEMAEQLGQSTEDVANFSWHMRLKRTMDIAWQADYNQPAPGTLFVLWDHMAPQSSIER